MRKATRVITSTFGTIMAFAGLEHGIGEVLQGNVAPSGTMFLSWPESAFFRSLGGEPAMTVIPNLLITGILAILLSLILFVWATRFIHRKNGGQVMILLSIILLLVGGGIFPPVLGFLIGAVGTRMHAPSTAWRMHFPVGFPRFLGKLWPGSFIACLIGWLFMFPGLAILGYFFGVNSPGLIVILLFFDLATLLIAIFAGFAYDRQGANSASAAFE